MGQDPASVQRSQRSDKKIAHSSGTSQQDNKNTPPRYQLLMALRLGRKGSMRPKKKSVKKLERKHNKRCKLHDWCYFWLPFRQLCNWSPQPKSGKPDVPSIPHNHMACFGTQEDQQQGNAGSLAWPIEHLDRQPKHPVSACFRSESNSIFPTIS